MKLTLAFHVYNKAEWLPSVLDSWLLSLSGKHDVEVIVICDRSPEHGDGSADVARRVLARHLHGTPHLANMSYLVEEVVDLHEVAASNYALQMAAEDSDWIVFIQGDNWMYDYGWDDLLIRAVARAEYEAELPAGAVGFLAGVYWTTSRDGLGYQRVEANRPHKTPYLMLHGIPPDKYGLNVYMVDFVCRPFAVQTGELRARGGLDRAFLPFSWDDTDLSMKLLLDGYMNLYVPFDVVNVNTHASTIGAERFSHVFKEHRFEIVRRYGSWIRDRGNNGQFESLFSLKEISDASWPTPCIEID